ncbi:uncharacterized protein N7515_005784 [Penicillium bovifimosum]|uniref:Uncharacterized protein n=1 Tax=Penicillium bovifimosum TaxID=126998 RepID=A0A9W9GTG0_9EURO|nr:uncharacterized protein N7515_005784 [Penicillium bovifimosum]KAJ5129745.1 hypothetical protein N7515_005784 [Penicillium bovifimosum]
MIPHYHNKYQDTLLVCSDTHGTGSLPTFIPSTKRDTDVWLKRELVEQAYGYDGEAGRLSEGTRQELLFRGERVHSSYFQNSALLIVYASPHTPSLGDEGFQCPR